MRLGAFVEQLGAWAERPCVLTILVPAVDGRLAIAGILRPYFSLASIHGWALVPPQQHGGFAAIRLLELELERSSAREVIDDDDGRRLRYRRHDEMLCELTRDAAPFTAPPRRTRRGRYLYVGGRRRPVPEPWMLE
ncbi:MAG TPA: hypothetical protein VMD91_12430 [Candidatus Sulfotelmatobacter sp.]|nr:hypothetical protein [Candidatus Sulfotelmatobacter sp.]